MSAPAGWYPQPDGQQRYWDGEQWTEHFAPGTPLVTPPAIARKNWFLRHKVITAVGAVLLLAIFSNLANGGSKSVNIAPAAESVATSSAADQAAADQAAADKAAADQAAAKKADAERKAAADKAAAAKAVADKAAADKAAAAKAVADKYEGRPYEIVTVDENVSNARLNQYWVYTRKFDYSTAAYKGQVKMIIADIARKEKTTKLIVQVVTDKEIIEAESNSTIAGFMDEHGADYWKNVMVPKEKSDWVAWYTGGFDYDAGQPSESAAAFEILWRPAATEQVEKWKP